jgi:hypothetical protein
VIWIDVELVPISLAAMLCASARATDITGHGLRRLREVETPLGAARFAYSAPPGDRPRRPASDPTHIRRESGE